MRRQTERTDGWWLSPSGAGQCARMHILKATEDYWLKPGSVWSLVVGTSMHSGMEVQIPGTLEEQRLAMPMRVPILDPDGKTEWVDFVVQGTTDYYDAEYQRVIDYKFPSEFTYWDNTQRKEVTKDMPDEVHEFQINIYRMLLEYHGHPVKSLKIFYNRPYKGAPRQAPDVPLWDLEDVYERAVEAAIPLVEAMKYHRLPPCTCRWRNTAMDEDICKTVTDEGWVASRGWERVPDASTYRGNDLFEAPADAA